MVASMPVRIGTSDHYFESVEHRAAFLESILAGEVSLKFAYAGSAATTHDRLARSEGYRGVTRAIRTEANLLQKALGGSSIRLYDIGSGNGDHTAALIEELAHRGIQTSEVILCDFAADLMAIARKRISSKFGRLSIQSLVWDVESQYHDLSDSWSPTTVLMLVGHTLGNPTNPRQVLRNLRRSTFPAARLLLSVTAYNPSLTSADVLAPYATDVFMAAAIEPFLALGLPKESVSFSLSIEDHAVIGITTILRESHIDGVVIPTGHKVVSFRSRRFMKEDVTSMLRDTGWKIVLLDFDDGHLVIFAESGAT